MSDIVGYILVLGLFVLPGYALVQLAVRIMQAAYENQSVVLSFPFP
jgi:hypothetical protein